MKTANTVKKLGAAALILSMSLAGAAMAENHEFISVSASDAQGEIVMNEIQGVLYDGSDNELDPGTANWPVRFSYDDEAMTCELSSPDQTLTGTYVLNSREDDISEMTATMEDGTVFDLMRDAGEEINILIVTAADGSDVTFKPVE